MDFLSNLEKILVVLSPEIGESYFQKAEGSSLPTSPRSRCPCYPLLLNNSSCSFDDDNIYVASMICSIIYSHLYSVIASTSYIIGTIHKIRYQFEIWQNNSCMKKKIVLLWFIRKLWMAINKHLYKYCS